MPDITLTLTAASFIAGVLMFLAPCTLPLLPAYLAFISGVSPDDAGSVKYRSRVILNGALFVVGFTVVFVGFGMLAGFFGGFVGPLRSILTQVGGIFITLFGLLMLNIIRFAPLMSDHKLALPKFVKAGEPSSALIIGFVFALGWTPCVGPVLASVLLLATTSSTALSGGLLLLVFSLGLAVPFMFTALLYAKASEYIATYSYISLWVSRIGGLFLIGLGLLLVTDNFGLLLEYGYQLFDLLGFNGLFQHF